MPKNNTTTNDSSHQPGKNRVPIASDADGNEKPGKSATLFFIFYALNQRHFHTWMDSLGTFFETFAVMKISKNDSNII